MKSLWHDTVSLPPFPRLERDLRTDVLIIGGGLTGILCAYLLAQEGIDYVLVEAGRICSSTSGNTTAKITLQHGLIYHKLIREFGEEKARMYLDANREALARYRTLCETPDCDYEVQDAFVYSRTSKQKLYQELAAYATLGIPGEFVKDIPLPLSVAGAVRIRDQAQFHPLKFAAALVKKLNIFENTPVNAFDGTHFLTPYGGITAAHTIVATHFPMFSKHGGYPMKLYQHRSYVIAMAGAPKLNGMYVDESGSGFSFRSHGDLLLLGGGAHRTGKPGDGWKELRAFARQHWPDAQEVFHWAAQDCMSLDSVPYIGEYSAGKADLSVATGFNKWGITSSMVAAILLSNRILGRETPWAAVFSPARSILRPQLLSNIFHAGANLLTLTAPRCPHMGCALKWNPKERSWDCPCHGSRFDKNGHLLDGPANADHPKLSLRRKDS